MGDKTCSCANYGREQQCVLQPSSTLGLFGCPMAVCISHKHWQCLSLSDKHMKEIGISQWPYEYLKLKDHIVKVTWNSRLVFTFMFRGSVCVSRCSKCAGRTVKQGVLICGAAFCVCCSFNCISAICLVQHVEQTPFFIILISQEKHWQGHGKLLIQLNVGDEAAEDQAFGKDSMPLSRQRQETRAPFPLIPLEPHHRAVQAC